ncbi:unnamed protein product, partial [Schistosoma mattheei]
MNLTFILRQQSWSVVSIRKSIIIYLYTSSMIYIIVEFVYFVLLSTVANVSSKHGNSVSRDSIQPPANITNTKHKNTRPTGLNFMTEKSEILDDSQMLLKHLSPNNEFQCVNGCTVVVTTTCQLTHCYPLCIIDRTLTINETNGHHNKNENQTDVDVMITNNDNNMSTIVTLTSITSTTIMTTTSATTCASVSSISTNHHGQHQQFKEKSFLTKPKCALP